MHCNLRFCTSFPKTAFSKSTKLLKSSSIWVWISQYTLRFLCMSGVFFVPWWGCSEPKCLPFLEGQDREKKCFNFTHRCKSLNCFKPSVTWEEFFYIWKQRLEASNMSDKKSWKLQSYLAVCSISCNQSFCFVVLAWWQRTSVNVIVSKKLMKFFPVSVQPVQ